MDRRRFQLINVLGGVFHISLFYAVTVLTDLTVWPISTGAVLAGGFLMFIIGIGSRITLIESVFERGGPLMITFFTMLTFAATTNIISANTFTSLGLGFGVGCFVSAAAVVLLPSE